MNDPVDPPTDSERGRPLPGALFLAGLVLVVAGAVASSMLLVDYVRPAPVFCDGAGACAAMKRTIFAYPFGIPMPVFGLSAFVALGLAWVVPGRRMQLTQGIVGLSAGLIGLGLISVQLSMGTICPFCAVTDTAALGLAALGLLRMSRRYDPPGPLALKGVAVGVTTLSAIVPAAIGLSRAPSYTVPSVIHEEMAATPLGKVTLVDFVDFECPFCRATHAELKPVLAQAGGKVRVARKHVPLRMHPHAMDAARAACCGERLGKGEEVAEALFSMPPEEMTAEGCAKVAKEAGLDPAAFAACLGDPAIEARIKKDAETFRAAEGHGLPTLWVDTIKLEGAQDRADLENAFRKVGAL